MLASSCLQLLFAGILKVFNNEDIIIFLTVIGRFKMIFEALISQPSFLLVQKLLFTWFFLLIVTCKVHHLPFTKMANPLDSYHLGFFLGALKNRSRNYKILCQWQRSRKKASPDSRFEGILSRIANRRNKLLKSNQQSSFGSLTNEDSTTITAFNGTTVEKGRFSSPEKASSCLHSCRYRRTSALKSLMR